MSRINVVEKDSANEEQAALYAGIQQALGTVPNFLKVFANSPAALRAFLGLHGIAGEGSLTGYRRQFFRPLRLGSLGGCVLPPPAQALR